MSEVDEIDDELRGPVNCWLNNAQQTRYARLLVLARGYERMNDTSPVKVHDRPPSTPEDFAERNRPGSAFGLP
jgi:hypothetical protein